MVTAITLQQSMVRVNLHAEAGVQSRLNTIVQCVCQEAQWFRGGSLVWDQCRMGAKWDGILGQVLQGSFTLEFDSHD